MFVLFNKHNFVTVLDFVCECEVEQTEQCTFHFQVHLNSRFSSNPGMEGDSKLLHTS